MNANVTFPIQKALAKMTCRVTITGLRRFTFRMRCVIGLIRLAAWIAPIHMTVDVEESPCR